MNQLQQIFQYHDHQVRTVIKDSEPWFVAKDVCDILEISNPTMALQRLDDDERAKFNLGRQGETNIVNEPGLYTLILGSRKPEAKAFKRWITHEVIPTIRKTGGYVSEDREEEFIRNYFPSFSDEVKQAMILDLKKQNSDLKQKLKLQKPKVLFADAVETSESSILVGELAKILIQNGVKTVTINGREKKMGQNNLFIWLRDNGYLCKKKGEMFNLPTQYSIDNGLFEIKKRTQQNPDGSIRVTRTPKVTGKGQIYFVNKFLESKTTDIAL